MCSRVDIGTLLEQVSTNSGPLAANRLLAALSALLSWGMKTGLIQADVNPVAFTVRNPEKATDQGWRWAVPGAANAGAPRLRRSSAVSHPWRQGRKGTINPRPNG